MTTPGQFQTAINNAIAVGRKDKLIGVIDAVIAAAKAGALDDMIAATQKLGQKPKAK